MVMTKRNDVPMVVERDGVELRMDEVGGGMDVAFVKFPAGTDMAPNLKGLPDDMCQCPHWGYVLKGRLKMRTQHGDEVYEAGQAFYWAPGHAPEALEDCEYVDFSPTGQFQETLDHVKAQMS